MVQNPLQPSLEELAVRAKTAAIQAKDDSLNSTQQQQALLKKQIALTELMSLLTTELPKPSSMDSSAYIYEEALQEMLLYICKNIDKYDPERGSIMSWVMFIFKKRRISVFHWINWNGKVISIYKDGDESEKDFFDFYCLPDVSNPLTFEELMTFIKEDPEKLLANTLFNHNPKASFQVILLKRYEDDKSWKEIVQELKLGPTSGPISTFYRRCCKKFAPYFKRYLCE